MSEIQEYDSGPLSWVKDEIDQALLKTHDALSQFNPAQDDPATLRTARTHFHQVCGAIEMVGLQGVTLLCKEAEKLLQSLENQTAPSPAAALDMLTRSTHAIGLYLDDLLKGKPNLELRLHPLYAELKAATGNAHSAESDLFFPDLSLRAPKTAAAANLSDAELKDLIKKSRSQFQRGLLGFLRQQNADQGLAAMRSAVHQIELAMALPANRTLWWGTTAFVDCLINHAIEPDFAVKQLCGRIDLQMRRQSEGSFQVAERLFKDILYFVAKSAHVSAHVTQVKETFALDSLIPSGAGENTEMATLQPLLAELRKLLAPAKETWLKFSAGNRDSLAQFHAQIMQLQDRTAALKSAPLQLLLAQVASTTAAILPAERLDSIGLEVATALLLVQNTLENYQHVTGELVQQADVQVQRLRAAAAGELDTAHIPDVPLLDEMSRQAQERLLIAQVAHEVQTNLQQIEETLDAFFRDPRNERAALAQVHSPLAQVQGALSILQLDDASQMLQTARATITQFSDATRPVDEADFSLVADALSSLGLYVNALRHQRSDAQQILLPVLRKMGLVAPAPEVKTESDTAATEHSVEAGLD